MTSDMMVICEEDKSSYDGGGVGAVFICECSMGDPLNEFGEWFQSRFCGSPSMIEQMAGAKDHYFTKVTKADAVAVDYAFKTMKHNTGEEFCSYMYGHIGKHISIENW